MNFERQMMIESNSSFQHNELLRETMFLRMRANFLAVILMATFFSASANAQPVRTWTNPTGLPSPVLQVSSNWLGGVRPGAGDIALFNLPNTYEVWWSQSTPGIIPGVLGLEVSGGDVTFYNSDWNNMAEFQIADSGPSALLISNSTLNLRGIHLNALGGATVDSGGLLRVDGSHPSGSMLSVDDFFGLEINGQMQVESGGIADVRRAKVGENGEGTLTITGSGSKFSSSIGFFAGSNYQGTVNVLSQAELVSRGRFYIGTNPGVTGTVNVRDDLSKLDNGSGELFVGSQGIGFLNVSDGGTVKNGDAYIAREAGSQGTVNVGSVNGVVSTWTNRDLSIGGSAYGAGGAGTLNINQDGLVTVNGVTKIWSTGTVNMNGGRFEFDEMTIGEFNAINANAGSMKGLVSHSDYTHAASLSNFQTPVDVSEVKIVNSGVLYGNASLGGALRNEWTGEINVQTGERMRFGGVGNGNHGEINNSGGSIRFDQTMFNGSSGFIAGRGQFVANGGWTNTGVMAFSGGHTDVHGDILNYGGGQIITSGGATTTFYDDVVHIGGEIRTAAGSNSVFFGEVSGAGSYTGTGTIFFEGDLRPGNSPGIVDYEGDVILGSLATMHVELAGREFGEYDRLQVAGDLLLDGLLTVDLLDNFQLTWNDEFLIAEVGGSFSGQFTGLGEGDRVGNFGGMDLFITYSGGTGNDLALFTAVPEPGAAILCASGLMAAMLRIRRRRKDLS